MITLTGIDEKTDLKKVKEMATGTTEFAVLLTADPEGRNRYPSVKFVVEALNFMEGLLAVHVCGKVARRMCLNGAFREALRKAHRIQVNGEVTSDELKEFLSLYDRQHIITQHTEANRRLLMEWGDGRHQLLVDDSGGRGVTPKDWIAPNTSKKIGFAGGLGPDNLAEEILRMPGCAWVDMESRLRINDWFSIERAATCIAEFWGSVNRSRVRGWQL